MANDDSDRQSPDRRASIKRALLDLELRHIAASTIILTICSSVLIEVLQTGTISPERIRNLSVLAGGLFGVSRAIELLARLLDALENGGSE